jgi:GT2 family glycosyltransferase
MGQADNNGDAPDLRPGLIAQRRARERGPALELSAARRALQRGDATLRELERGNATLRELVQATQRSAAAAQASAEASASAQTRLEQRCEAAERQRDQLTVTTRQQDQLITEQRRRARELEQTNATLTATLAEVRRDILRAEASRAWRWGHAVMALSWRLRGRQIRTGGALPAALARIDRIDAAPRALAPAASPAAPPPPVIAARRAQLPLEPAEQRAVDDHRAALASEIRRRLGPAPEREHWPTVSAVIVSHNGRLLLERLMHGLVAHTDYTGLEVTVVDNGSSDDTLDYLSSLRPPFALTVTQSPTNLSYAEANALGAADSTGELLLFLNNDVEPFEPGWLKELVAGLDTGGVAAAGACLLHAEAPGDPTGTEPLIQHRAIGVRWEDGTVRGYNVGDGVALWEAQFGIDHRCPAVTAACMLISREAFDRTGGFDPHFRFGTEDVDLGLKLTAGGDQLVGVGRSVLVHRESSSQVRSDPDFRRANRTNNRRVLLERWGPQLLRAYRLGRLRRDPFWTDGVGPHVAITVTDLDPAAGWGDWYTAHELGDALSDLGWRITYVQRRDAAWYSLPADLDHVITLMDAFDVRRVPDHVDVIAWIRNWTERWLQQPWFERIDILLASSERTAELIQTSTGRPSIRFPLATNPARFHPIRTAAEALDDYVYTGNRWGEERGVERAVSPRPTERFRVFGRGWEGKRLTAFSAGPAAYEELPAIYAGSKLVLDDTQGPTLPYGALNARVLDALAAGALVLTDCEAGVRELFDAEFPVWHDAASLREQLDRLLGDDDRRRELARRYRATVLGRHTYAHRAAQLRDVLVQHTERLSFAIKIGAPDRARAQHWGDLHFATALAEELRRRGHRTLIQTLDEWDSEAGLRQDVSLHLRGLTRSTPRPGQLNVLWSISHPAELTGEECDGFDLVCVASVRFARALAERTATPVIVLEQATDPRRFHPDPLPGRARDLAYVANSRGVLRPMMRDLAGGEHDLAVWGGGWHGLIPDRWVVAEHVPNHELRHIYSSAEIVLCDHWEDMREHGYVSNRIYDALACGAFLISDAVEGLEEIVGDAVVTYRTPEELAALITRFLADPEERSRRAAHGRERVLASHTFAQRADVLLEQLDTITGERRSTLAYSASASAPSVARSR